MNNNNNQSIRFTEEELIKFINEWDPIKEKYFFNYQDAEIDTTIYNRIWNCFYIDANSSVSKEKMNKVYKTVNQIYFDKKSDRYMKIIETVFNKFIYQFVNIEGIDVLFDSKYFNMEWTMHFDYDFEKYTSTYYRDHYLHQVRNMFEMLTILDKLKFDNYCNEWFNTTNTNSVCDYIKSLLKFDVSNMPSKKYKLYKDIVKVIIKNSNPHIYKNMNMDELEDNKNSSPNQKEIVNSIYEEYILKQLFHELIYSSAIISSLIHDIGYPLSFILKSNKNISTYIPNSMHFISEIRNIEYIDSKLKDSLLYKVVGIDEISERLEKYDHGVLSAIILLLYYYDNGKIYSLSKTEKAIIELSSLIIFNHTIDYQDQEGGELLYKKNIFAKNPMSYIFRLCDDIQEWERVYFENTTASNFTICTDCKTPLLRVSTGDTCITYGCMCNSENTYNLRANEYRKTINVICCKEVEIKYDESSENIPKNKTIIFKYDLFNLMEIAKYNPGYAKVRAEEIKKIKIALSYQKDLHNTYVDFFMSNNPIEIKLEILKRYLNKNHNICDIDGLLNKIGLNILSSDNFPQNTVKNFIHERFKIYYQLVTLINNIGNKTKEVFQTEFDKIIDNIDNRDFIILAKLARDKYYNLFLCNKKKMKKALETYSLKEYKALEDIYLNLHLTSEKEMIIVNNYYDIESYINNQNDKSKDNWNNYLDLYYFYLMNDNLNKE